MQSFSRWYFSPFVFFFLSLVDAVSVGAAYGRFLCFLSMLFTMRTTIALRMRLDFINNAQNTYTIVSGLSQRANVHSFIHRPLFGYLQIISYICNANCNSFGLKVSKSTSNESRKCVCVCARGRKREIKNEIFETEISGALHNDFWLLRS